MSRPSKRSWKSVVGWPEKLLSPGIWPRTWGKWEKNNIYHPLCVFFFRNSPQLCSIRCSTGFNWTCLWVHIWLAHSNKHCHAHTESNGPFPGVGHGHTGDQSQCEEFRGNKHPHVLVMGWKRLSWSRNFKKKTVETSHLSIRKDSETRNFSERRSPIMFYLHFLVSAKCKWVFVSGFELDLFGWKSIYIFLVPQNVIGSCCLSTSVISLVGVLLAFCSFRKMHIWSN